MESPTLGAHDMQGGGGQQQRSGSPGSAASADAAARSELLQALGIRNRAALWDVPVALLRAWQPAISHPGLAARFADPAGFAYVQLRAGNQPPSARELDRWAQPGGWPAAHTSRHITPPPIDLERHNRLLAQARALGGESDDLVCFILLGLDQGMGADDALAYGQAELAKLPPLSGEVAHAARA